VLLVNMRKTAGVGLHIIREADLLSQFGKKWCRGCRMNSFSSDRGQLRAAVNTVWTFMFSKRLGISCLAERISAPQSLRWCCVILTACQHIKRVLLVFFTVRLHDALVAGNINLCFARVSHKELHISAKGFRI
jgi:hypothetical protein